jgi:hypothetical protein
MEVLFVKKSIKILSVSAIVACVGTSVIGMTLHQKSEAANNPTYEHMLAYRNSKQKYIEHLQKQAAQRAKLYNESHPHKKAAPTKPFYTAAQLGPKPKFSPQPLSQSEILQIPGVDNSLNGNLPHSGWTIMLVPDYHVGLWLPIEAVTGYSIASSQKGFISLYESGTLNGFQQWTYSAPVATGTLTITGVKGTDIVFSTADHQIGTFNVKTHQWHFK